MSIPFKLKPNLDPSPAPIVINDLFSLSESQNHLLLSYPFGITSTFVLRSLIKYLNPCFGKSFG
jgi:hypothetical protein